MTDRLTDADLERLSALGIDGETAERQLDLFRNPPPATKLVRPCTVGDGIVSLGETRARELAAHYDREVGALEPLKFVPASGAASRMFKALLANRDRPAPDADDPAHDDPEWGQVRLFIDQLDRFAFAGDLDAELARRGTSVGACRDAGDTQAILGALLDDDGLAYASKPKALLAFHRRGDEIRTPLEEQLVEALAYARDAESVCRLHFTVSPEHGAGFAAAFERVGPKYRTGGLRFDIETSEQQRSTDTIAVDEDNRPFRDEDGHVLLRPGGHGALIGNLGAAGGDPVFVKNIDNVVTESLHDEVVLWKKALAGLLLEVRAESHRLLERLRDGDGDPSLLDTAAAFLADRFGIDCPAGDAAGLIGWLDRPLRVCGMVANESDPGGGPFWVRDRDGAQVRPQIVETAEVDASVDEQRRILSASTHFNPVDLVCSLRRADGTRYDVADYVDRDAVFLSSKSYAGRPLKALELPGLWNGAMAGWNTLFVEVPRATFQPVKTVVDLLEPAHQ